MGLNLIIIMLKSYWTTESMNVPRWCFFYFLKRSDVYLLYGEEYLNHKLYKSVTNQVLCDTQRTSHTYLLKDLAYILKVDAYQILKRQEKFNSPKGQLRNFNRLMSCMYFFVIINCRSYTLITYDGLLLIPQNSLFQLQWIHGSTSVMIFNAISLQVP